MKKLIVCLIGLLTFCTVQAQNTAAQTEPAPWDFISFTFVPGIPPADSVYDVYGVKVGVPIGFSEKTFVAGTEISIISSMTPYVYGVQGAILFNQAKLVEGLQASFIYNEAKDVKGLQFSLVNYAEDSAVQIGLVNIIKNSPLCFFPFVNLKF